MARRLFDVAVALAVGPAGVVAARGTDVVAVAAAGFVFVAGTLWLCRHVNRQPMQEQSR